MSGPGGTQDFTRRKSAEEELPASRHFLAVLVKNLCDGIVACDADGVITVCNGVWQRLHGVSQPLARTDQEGEGYQVYPVGSRTPLGPGETPLALALAGQTLRNVELVVLTAAGETHAVAVNGQPVVDGDGRKVGAVVVVHDLSAQRQAEAEVARHMLHDELTGLPNRPLLLAHLGETLSSGRQPGSRTAVLLLDLERLRDINAYLGHAAGDDVLCAVARRIEAAAAQAQMVGRVGVDEFAVVLGELADEKAAISLARSMLETVSQPLHAAGTDISITAAVGIAVATDGPEPEEVMGDAEVALCRAKEDGAGGYAVFSRSMRRDRPVRADRGKALLRALEGGDLRLLYQPKFSLETDRLMGVEALMRWEDPERGTVPPSEFIPLAEDTGLIVPMGAWALEEACRQGAEWSASFPDRPPLLVSVNVSPRQFQAGLIETVKAALKPTTFEARTLCIEVTESTVMDEVEVAIALLTALKELGITVSIDDFGTGYSSLAYLKRFPLDMLKVDRSFVAGLGRDVEDTAIVAAIVAMAHALDLRVVAEGVETEEQLERLRTLGCEYAQGYYFARPEQPAAVNALLGAEASATRSQSRSRRGGGEKVLIADDSADVRLLARMSLLSAGFEVIEAASGREAVELANEARPDCVVLDVMMPDMTGIEVCEILRSDPETSEATILIVSANSLASDKAQAFSVGADDYIVKPVSPRDLVSRARSAMRRRGLRA